MAIPARMQGVKLEDAQSAKRQTEDDTEHQPKANGPPLQPSGGAVDPPHGYYTDQQEQRIDRWNEQVWPGRGWWRPGRRERAQIQIAHETDRQEDGLDNEQPHPSPPEGIAAAKGHGWEMRYVESR